MEQKTPTACGSGEPPMKIRLVLLCQRRFGRLEIECPGGRKITVENLCQRHINILLAMNDTFRKEASLPAPLRGWMTNEEIAEGYTQGNQRWAPPSVEAIRAYRSQINEKIRSATHDGMPPPAIFESRKGGSRLVVELEIVDISEQREGEAGRSKPAA